MTTVGLFFGKFICDFGPQYLVSWQTRRSTSLSAVKDNGKWTTVSVEIPKLKSDNTLYLKDNREGKFKISWYEGKKKQRHPATFRTLGDRLRHSKFVALRDDKNPRTVVKET